MLSKLISSFGEKFEKFVKFVRGDHKTGEKRPTDTDQEWVLNLTIFTKLSARGTGRSAVYHCLKHAGTP